MGASRRTTVDLDLDRDAGSAAERLALWRDAMELVGKVTFREEASFTGRLLSRDFDDMHFMRIESKTFRFVRDKDMARRMRRDHVIINVIERGRFVGKLAHRRIDVGPGSVLISRMANPMDLTMEDAAWLGAFFPRAIFEKVMPWTTSLDARTFAPETAQALLLGSFVRSVGGLPDPLPVRQASCAMRSGLALVSACLGGKIPAQTPVREPDEDVARSIRRFIAQRLADHRLGPDLISTEFNISRSRLYRIMGDGGDIAATIRHLRLHAIHRDIVSKPQVALATTSKRWGLTDERNFRRAFVKEFGYPPSELRKKAQDDGNARPVDTGKVRDALERWLLDL